MVAIKERLINLTTLKLRTFVHQETAPQNEKTIQKLGEDICNGIINKGVVFNIYIKK